MREDIFLSSDGKGALFVVVHVPTGRYLVVPRKPQSMRLVWPVKDYFTYRINVTMKVTKPVGKYER